MGAARRALLVYLATVTILLAASRTGVAAALVAVGLWLWLADRRVEGALLGLAGAVPAALLAGWAFTRPALVDDGQAHSDRVRDGAWFARDRGARRRGGRRGRAVGVGAGAAAATRDRPRARARQRGVVVLAGLVALVIAVGNPVSWGWDQFASERAPRRLTPAG